MNYFQIYSQNQNWKYFQNFHIHQYFQAIHFHSALQAHYQNYQQNHFHSVQKFLQAHYQNYQENHFHPVQKEPLWVH
jgi:hypothetical protein